MYYNMPIVVYGDMDTADFTLVMNETSHSDETEQWSITIELVTFNSTVLPPTTIAILASAYEYVAVYTSLWNEVRAMLEQNDFLCF